MPYEMICGNCGKVVKAVWPNTKYCSPKCRQEQEIARTGRVTSTPGLASGTVGAIGELKVAADLLRRGFGVFRAVSPACPCDLAILKAKKLLRIEVTTGYRSKSGLLTHPKKADVHTGKFDILAIVLPDEIIYEPRLPKLKTP